MALLLWSHKRFGTEVDSGRWMYPRSSRFGCAPTDPAINDEQPHTPEPIRRLGVRVSPGAQKDGPTCSSRWDRFHWPGPGTMEAARPRGDYDPLWSRDPSPPRWMVPLVTWPPPESMLPAR